MLFVLGSLQRKRNAPDNIASDCTRQPAPLADAHTREPYRTHCAHCGFVRQLVLARAQVLQKTSLRRASQDLLFGQPICEWLCRMLSSPHALSEYCLEYSPYRLSRCTTCVHARTHRR